MLNMLIYFMLIMFIVLNLAVGKEPQNKSVYLKTSSLQDPICTM